MGGIGSYVRNVTAALAMAGHDVHVFTFTLPRDVLANIPAGITVHETPDLAARVATNQMRAMLAMAISSAGDGMYRLGIAQMLTAAFLGEHAARPFDVVECPEVEALGLPLLLSRVNVPVVTHLHCATAIAYEANGVEIGDRERLITSLEFAAIHLSDGVCAPTRRVVELTESQIGHRLDTEIIPHTLIAKDRGFTAPSSDGPILFVGRLERLKGCELLADALKIFLVDNTAATFKFLGPDTHTGPGGRSMRQHIESVLGPALSRRVSFLGEVGRDVVDTELAGCSFCVMPSLTENFSMAVCEAMSTGRAVVVGAGTGSVEIVDNPELIADRGSSTDLARVMTRLWRDRSALVTISKRAQDRVDSLCDPEVTSRQRVRYYQSVIDRFAATHGDERIERLAALPPTCVASILPAISTIAGILCGVSQTADSPGAKLLRIMEDSSSRTGSASRVLLYGAGKYTTRLLSERHRWEAVGHAVTAIIDDHPRFRETPEFLGLPVRSLASAVESARSGEPFPPIVLSTDTYTDQFWTQTAPLRALGVEVHRLCA
jgi:glycosyltransferase involved in cell wall biosynthesis